VPNPPRASGPIGRFDRRFRKILFEKQSNYSLPPSHGRPQFPRVWQSSCWLQGIPGCCSARFYAP